LFLIAESLELVLLPVAGSASISLSFIAYKDKNSFYFYELEPLICGILSLLIGLLNYYKLLG
jgi:hypothetical protein